MIEFIFKTIVYLMVFLLPASIIGFFLMGALYLGKQLFM